MQEGLILCRFVHFGAVLLMFGIGLFRCLLLRSLLLHRYPDASGSGPESPESQALQGTLRWLSAVALISAVSWLMLTAANMSGDGYAAVDWQTLGLVLGKTFFGHVWIIHLGLSVLAFIGSFGLLTPMPLPRLLLNTLLLLTLAPVGHGAMFDGINGQLLVLNQMLHLIGVGAWLGGLVMLAVLLGTATQVDVQALLRRFTGIGYGLVALIIVTGMINVRALSGAPWPEPAFSGFGLVLAVKLALVLGMLALAAVNRHLAQAAELRTGLLRVSIVLECLLGAAALAAVSLLGTLPPMLA